MRSNMFGAVAVLALFAVAYGETTEETFTIDVKTAACNGYKLTSLKKEQAVSVFITDVGGSDSIKCSASANAAAMRVSELSLKQSDCAPNFKDDNLWGLTSKEITTEVTCAARAPAPKVSGRAERVQKPKANRKAGV
mmetsp:Transcript_39108/g.124499  ORF Transcript_39108/g.124499 Transcript_39108/m.124499 type:complete len:137 (-) Transcript_39108:502-912(-)